MGGETDSHVGARLVLTCPRYRGDTGGGQPSPPMFPSVRHYGSMAISERDAPVHSAVQEEGGEEATALGRGGLKGGHLKGFQHLWDPP